MINRKGRISPIVIIIILIAALAFTGIFYFQSRSRKTLEKNTEVKNGDVSEKKEASVLVENSLPSQDVFSGNREEYKKIIGEWDTGCLIADPKKPFVERHEFSIKENGVARHWRSSGENCENLKKESAIHNYKIEIPEIGKINFIALDKNTDTIYDIYKITGGILYFGHGPRDWYPLSLRNFGGSLETRFDALNDFLKYKKK